jgi:hypothetical protein
VRDAHEVIVDDVREVVGREAVGLDEDLVVELCGLELHLAAEAVLERDLARARHGEPHDERLARGDAGLALGDGAPAAQAVVAHEQPLSALLVAHGLEALGRAEAPVRRARRQQRLDVMLVDLGALALPVRPARPADVRALVPLQPHPVQRAQDGRLGLGRRPRAVGVLDAQDELAAVLLGERVVEERDVGRAHVRIARGRRSDADLHGARGGGGHARVHITVTPCRRA